MSAEPEDEPSSLALRPIRVLVLSADVGEGHLAAARALGEGLRELPGIAVVERDGLRSLGWATTHVMRDGYRFQLRWAPWTYSVMYWAISRVPLVRRAGAAVLYAVGRRRMRRLVREHRPDVVVSTHPALTCVLGRMRLRRRLDVPVCAPITDLADYDLWSNPGADLHLVMHEVAIAPVERVAGRGSVALVEPLVSRGFLARRDPAGARRALGLPLDRRLVLVSGGGWGVGDLEGAVRTTLELDDVSVVILAGRNDTLERALRTRFARDDRVHVWRFTDRMPELMHAADAIVHSTGGMTSLEALASGCPLIAYGATIGHIRVHNRTLGRLGLIRVADDPAQLRRALCETLDGPRRPAPSLRSRARPAELVAHVRPRVEPLPRWRVAAAPALAAVCCATTAIAGLSTDEAYSLVASPLELKATHHVPTRGRDVALVVQAPPASIPRIARVLRSHGIGATFALPAPPALAVRRAVAGAGDDTLPALGPSGTLAWIRTRGKLRAWRGMGPRVLYLAPRSGLNLGQYLLARSAHGTPVVGAAYAGADGALPGNAPLSAGDVVVVAVGASANQPAAASRLEGELAARGLGAASLGDVASATSTSVRSAGDRISSTAAAATSARPATITSPPSGVPVHRSPVSSGARSTGTQTWTTKTSGAVCVAGRRCSAVISLSMARPDAAPVAAVHPAACSHAPDDAASATNFVDSPLHANPAPAASAASMPPGARQGRRPYGRTATTPSRASATASDTDEPCRAD